jgi:hypothetical protein
MKTALALLLCSLLFPVAATPAQSFNGIRPDAITPASSFGTNAPGFAANNSPFFDTNHLVVSGATNGYLLDGVWTNAAGQACYTPASQPDSPYVLQPMGSYWVFQNGDRETTDYTNPAPSTPVGTYLKASANGTNPPPTVRFGPGTPGGVPVQPDYATLNQMTVVREYTGYAWTPATNVLGLGINLDGSVVSAAAGITSMTIDGATIGAPISLINLPLLTNLTFTSLTNWNSLALAAGNLRRLSAPGPADGFGVVNLQGNSGGLTGLPWKFTGQGQGDFMINSFQSLTGLDFAGVTAISGRLIIENCAQLSQVQFTNLTSCGCLLLHCCGWTNLAFTSLTEDDGELGMNTSPLLAAVSAPLLAQIGQGGWDVCHCTNLAAVDLHSLQTIYEDGPQFSDTPRLQDLELTNLQNALYVTADTSGLTNFNAPNLDYSAVQSFRLRNCQLTAACVNAILRRAVVSGMTNSAPGFAHDNNNAILDLSGGTSAKPGGQGADDVATLRARGIAVLTN